LISPCLILTDVRGHYDCFVLGVDTFESILGWILSFVYSEFEMSTRVSLEGVGICLTGIGGFSLDYIWDVFSTEK